MKRTLIPALALAAGTAAHAQYSAWLPAEQQFVATPGFTYSTFDRFWMGEEKMDNPPNGKSLEQFTTYVGLEYGILKDFAADVTVGYTWTETDAFGANHSSDRGLADTQVGLRYRFWDEKQDPDCWLPSMAIRVGGVIPGTYDEDFPFSAGDGAHGAEASLLFAREICPGFGAFADVGYRVREGEVPDDVFGSAGLYATLKGFTGSVAYRHTQGTRGPDIGDPGFGVDFGFPEVREISQNMEYGLGYTDAGGRFYQVFYAHTVDGRNTGRRDIVGVSVSLPFGGK